MNLVIDIGNTRAKLAVFENDKLINADVYDKIDIHKLKKDLCALITGSKPVKSVILSSVVNNSLKLTDVLPGYVNFLKLKPDTPLPIVNLYKTPDTLGSDRIAAVVGANRQFRGKNILVIDAGTCITYNFINSKNQFLGGSISPGIDMRFKALNKFTSNLPRLEINKPIRAGKIVGKNTDDSVLSGVLNGILAEVKGIITFYKQKYNGLKIVITGGDIAYFEKDLFKAGYLKKFDIFADPYLVLKGLNVILDYNV